MSLGVGARLRHYGRTTSSGRGGGTDLVARPSLVSTKPSGTPTTRWMRSPRPASDSAFPMPGGGAVDPFGVE